MEKTEKQNEQAQADKRTLLNKTINENKVDIDRQVFSKSKEEKAKLKAFKKKFKSEQLV